jgi:hypothetical protein
MATIGMMKLVFFGGDKSVPVWQIVIPILGIIVLGYTLFRNVYPFPTGVAWWGIGATLGWLALGVILVLARPGAAYRAGQLLTQSEGLSGKPAT